MQISVMVCDVLVHDGGEDQQSWLLHARDASLYVILYCLGESIGEVLYRARYGERQLDLYLPWGRSYPLLVAAERGPGGSGRHTLVPRLGEPLRVDPSRFESIHPVLRPEYTGRRVEPDPAASRELRLRLELRLRKADALQARSLPQTELWLFLGDRM